MFVRIVSADFDKTNVQIYLLEEYCQKKGWEVFISRGLKDIPEFVKDRISLALVLYAKYNEQIIEAKKQMEKGRAVITDNWDEICHAYLSGFPFPLRYPFGYIKDSLNSLVPTASFLLKVETNGLEDVLPGLTAEQYQKALLDLAGRKTEKGWNIIDGESDEKTIKKSIKSCLSWRPEFL